MKLGNWKVILAIACTVVLTLSAGWSAGAWSPRHDFELEGTWQVAVTLTNCSTGKPLSPNAFPSILTFANGGTMAEDTTNPAFGHGQRGAGQGFWQYEGHRTFTAKSIAFINFDTPTPTTGPAFKMGTQTIEQTIDFTDGPDAWSANATIQFADTTGNVYMQGCATATAKRFE